MNDPELNPEYTTSAKQRGANHSRYNNKDLQYHAQNILKNPRKNRNLIANVLAKSVSNNYLKAVKEWLFLGYFQTADVQSFHGYDPGFYTVNFDGRNNAYENLIQTSSVDSGDDVRRGLQALEKKIGSKNSKLLLKKYYSHSFECACTKSIRNINVMWNPKNNKILIIGNSHINSFSHAKLMTCILKKLSNRNKKIREDPPQKIKESRFLLDECIFNQVSKNIQYDKKIETHVKLIQHVFHIPQKIVNKFLKQYLNIVHCKKCDIEFICKNVFINLCNDCACTKCKKKEKNVLILNECKTKFCTQKISSENICLECAPIFCRMCKKYNHCKQCFYQIPKSYEFCRNCIYDTCDCGKSKKRGYPRCIACHHDNK